MTIPTSIAPGRCSVASRLLNPPAPPVDDTVVGSQHHLFAGKCVLLVPTMYETGFTSASRAQQTTQTAWHSTCSIQARGHENSAPFGPLPVPLLKPPCRRPALLLVLAPPSSPGIHSWKLAVRVTVTFCRQLLAAPPSPPTCCCCCARRVPKGGRPAAVAAEGPRLMAVTEAAADCGGAFGNRTGLRSDHALSRQRQSDHWSCTQARSRTIRAVFRNVLTCMRRPEGAEYLDLAQAEAFLNALGGIVDLLMPFTAVLTAHAGGKSQLLMLWGSSGGQCRSLWCGASPVDSCAGRA